jgi:16S rRNA (guanine966-N2)-methyltransferase
MTRIIAGTARGRRLSVPARGTRPTSDRVREAVFSSLDSEWRAQGRRWPDVRVLDLFAGSGALGLEALSRGASAAVLVEKSRPAVETLRANVAAVGAPGARVLAVDARRLAGTAPEAAADLCFADPPYDWSAAELRALVADLVSSGWLAADCLVVVERPARDHESPLPDSWPVARRRDYGDTALWYGRREAGDDVQPEPHSEPHSEEGAP